MNNLSIPLSGVVYRTDDGNLILTGHADRASFSATIVSRLLAKISLECLVLRIGTLTRDIDPFDAECDELAAYARRGKGPFRPFAWRKSPDPQSLPRLVELEEGGGGKALVCLISFPGIAYLSVVSQASGCEVVATGFTVVDRPGDVAQPPQTIECTLVRVP